MALTANAGSLLPDPPMAYVDQPYNTSTGTLIDASGEKAGVCFIVPKSGTLDGVELLLGNVTQAPASGIRLSFQDNDNATGLYDGTQDQYRDVTTGLSSSAWIASGVMDHNGSGSGNKRSVTQGELLWLVMEFVSFSSGDSIRWATGATATTFIYPYLALNGAKGTNQMPLIVLKYSDGSYASINGGDIPPMKSQSTLAFASNNATQDEAGLIFRCNTPRLVRGFWMYADLDAAADVVLYDSDGSTPLATVSLDTDNRRTGNFGTVRALFSSDVSLSAGVDYRLVLKPTTTTNVSIGYFDVDSAGVMGACIGGADWHWTQRVDAGSWTQTTTRRPWAGLLVNGYEAGGGGGGLMVHPGMSGGIRG